MAAPPLQLPPSDWHKAYGDFLSRELKAASSPHAWILLWNQMRWRTPQASNLTPLQISLKTLMDTAIRSRSERVVCAWSSHYESDDDNNAEYSLLAPLLLAQDDAVVVLPDNTTTNAQRLAVRAGNGTTGSSSTVLVDIARIETIDGVSVAELSFPFLSVIAQHEKFETSVFDLGDYPNMERSLPLFHPNWSSGTGVLVFLGSLRHATISATIGFCDLHDICISGMLHNPGYDLVLNVSIRAVDRATDWILEQDVDSNEWYRQGKKTLQMRRDVSEGIWDLYMHYNTQEVIVALLFLVVATIGAWQYETGAFHFLFALVAVDQLREEVGLFRVLVQRRLKPFPKWGGRSTASPLISGNPVLKLGGVEPLSHTLLVVTLGIVEALYEIWEGVWPLRYTVFVGLFWGLILVLDMMWMVNISGEQWKLGEIGIDFGPDDPRRSFEAILKSNAIALSPVRVGSSRYVDSDEDSASWLTACGNPEVARRIHKSGWACFVRGSTDLSAGIGERWLLCGSMPHSPRSD